MKMSRDQLKNIVKECLVEILSEGLGNQQFNRSGVSEGGSRATNHRPKFDPALDRPVQRQQTAALKEAIKRESGGNPIMASIFADTAATTLSTMLNAGDTEAMPSAGSSRGVATEQFRGNPEDVFGQEAASKWANLAFMDTPKRT
jgi:hypothetical protein